MQIEDVKANAFAMPFSSPSFPVGPYRSIDREYMIITYRTDRAALERVTPEPLEIADPVVKYQFVRMPDCTRFGNYLGCAQGAVG